jgi:hypothetical protein
MKKTLLFLLIFAVTFVFLSILVVSKVSYSTARIKHTAREIEDQYDVINITEGAELADRMRLTNRSMEKGLVMLAANENKLQATVLLLIVNGMLCLGLGIRICWKSVRH